MEDAGIFFLTIPRIFLYYTTYFCLELIKHCRNTRMLLTTMAFGQPIWLVAKSNVVKWNDECGKPLAYDELDDTPDDLIFYGYDPNGPSPFEDSDINVIVSPIYHNETTAEILTILQTVDPFRPSTEMGIDVSWCSWFSWKHAERAEGMNRHFAKQVEHVVVKLVKKFLYKFIGNSRL